jgi:RNA polymerase sigma factor (sigma-70 family)
LLTRYAQYRDEDAFAEVVRRHVDLVHSAALRQVRSPELAKEVSQAVFIELAQQANQLAAGITVLAAWLYKATRSRAIDAVRRDASRRLREQTAQELQAMNATAEDWTHIEPLLDDAMHTLEETDRTAVLLRYFQKKPLREVGQALGVTDD